MKHLCRLISPKWANLPVLEGEFTDEEIQKYNLQGYQVFNRPNYPSNYIPGTYVDGSQIDVFNYVFVDCDLKDKKYASKDAFIEELTNFALEPSKVIDSGHGIHAYWKIQDLDAMSYLRLQRRLIRRFDTDEGTSAIAQTLRLPGTINTKDKDHPVPCLLLFESETFYSAEDMSVQLPIITKEDEEFCEKHYNMVYKIAQTDHKVDYKLPTKFGELSRLNPEVKRLFSEPGDDRSKDDFRLANLLRVNGFTEDEARSVLLNTAKASSRSEFHRLSYANNLLEAVGEFEKPKEALRMARSVRDILEETEGPLEGSRLPCYSYIDNTEGGFRRGQVMGLVAGSGVGKTSMALNLFLGFAASNPHLDHIFVPLEQPDREIALRWKNMCGKNTHLYDMVHIMNNYDEKGQFRDLSLKDIKDYVLSLKESGKEVGCVVIDHIGVLCNNNKLGQDEGVKEISKAMKGFAIETNTFLIMQSQTSREKAGVGDIELNKDAAFGTSVFENFCDYLVTLWQPLKRMYSSGAPTIMAYKFCKIRSKKQGSDVIQEDVPYALYFDPNTQLLRQITQDEQRSFEFYLGQATSKRKLDKKTELVAYTSVKWSHNV